MQTVVNPERHFVNPYLARVNDYSEWILSQQEAEATRGNWSAVKPLHVEIGTGNGFHFAHYAKQNPTLSVVGFEIKYKTLVQSIARARRFGCSNARMVKADAKNLTSYFAPGEVEKLIIHFPDPWPKARHGANRLLHASFFREAHAVLKDGGTIEFKTDHPGYFKWATRQVSMSPFEMTFYTENLHQSLAASSNYVTQFESLFLRKGQPIYHFTLIKR
jgi:tRNA (guanine-N7-)-methyltransferase